MQEYLSDLSCRQFTEQLASKAPIPGGGGVAALIGSLAAALAAMAANLTIGKKKFLPYEADHVRIIEETDALRFHFLELIDRDAAAFEPLSKAYSMDKNNPDYAAYFRSATLSAAAAPLEMVESCCKLIVLLEELKEKCSVLLLSDVGCAAITGRAAMEAAAMNVFVNTRLLPGDADAASAACKTKSMLLEYVPRAQMLADSVMNLLGA